MEKEHVDFEDEINDLKQELKNFQQEKERVRAILGKVGGTPKFRTKLINDLFVAAVIATVVISVVCGEKWRLLMIEFATVILSLKIIYLIHYQMRVNHFEFWILSSIEWRLNEMMKLIRRRDNNKE